MHDAITKLFDDFDGGTISRRQLLQALGVAAVGAPLSAALGQGRCRKLLNTPACVTAPIDPVFAPTGWKTVMLDRLTISVPDYRKEAAFYAALMGWTLRSDDGHQAVMDLGDWGNVVLKQGPPAPPADTTGRGGGGGGRGGAAGRPASNAVVQSFCWGIEPWDAKKVESELRKRGLDPVADNDGKDFQSFHVKDPDGFDLQISNGNKGNRRRTPANATLAEAAPFEPTGWKTVWLDHISFGATNYKKSASFYSNLLGWTPTYDEGSQHELMIGDIGDIIIRGGNPLDPNFGNGGGRGGAAGAPAARRTGIDHISFGIDPWDTDGVKAELEKRGLRAQIDTSTDDEIHVAAYKSYHTFTPNGFNLQISWTHKDNRGALNYAVYPRPAGQHRPPER